MRICISGTGCQGKSTLIDAFLERWPSYTTPKKTYRDLIVKEKYKHSKKQIKILNGLFLTICLMR